MKKLKLKIQQYIVRALVNENFPYLLKKFLEWFLKKLLLKNMLKITQIIHPNAQETKLRWIALSTLESLRDNDYNQNTSVKKYLNGGIMTLRQLFKKVPQNISKQEQNEIFDYSYLYHQVGTNNYWVEFEKKKIYVAESNGLFKIVEYLINKSTESPEYFGLGSESIENLLFEEFKSLFPSKVEIDSKSEYIHDTHQEYYQHVLYNLKKNFIFFLIPMPDGSLEKLIISLYRFTKLEEKGNLKDFIGGLLHLFKHLQIDKKPLAAINKTQKGKTEFHSDLFFIEIFEAFYYMRDEIPLDVSIKKYSFEFITSNGIKKKVGFFYNHTEKVWFINSIQSI